MCLPWHSSFGGNREEKEVWKLYLINKKCQEKQFIPRSPRVCYHAGVTSSRSVLENRREQGTRVQYLVITGCWETVQGWSGQINTVKALWGQRFSIFTPLPPSAFLYLQNWKGSRCFASSLGISQSCLHYTNNIMPQLEDCTCSLYLYLKINASVEEYSLTGKKKVLLLPI